MKKLNLRVMVGMVLIGLLAGAWTWTNSPPAMPDAPTWVGTTLGTGVKIDNGVVGGIAIGDDTGYCHEMADAAMQIGTGSNTLDKSMQFHGWGGGWTIYHDAAPTNVHIKMGLLPQPSLAAPEVGYDHTELLRIGDPDTVIPANPCWGFADPAAKTYGISAIFGRTTAATGAFWRVDRPDCGLNVQVMNNQGNMSQYSMEAAYFRAYNRTGGIVSNQTVLRLEGDQQATTATNSGISSLLKLEGDARTTYLIDADGSDAPVQGEIRFSNGLKLRVNTTNLIFVSANDATTNYCTLSATP